MRAHIRMGVHIQMYNNTDLGCNSLVVKVDSAAEEVAESRTGTRTEGLCQLMHVT